MTATRLLIFSNILVIVLLSAVTIKAEGISNIELVTYDDGEKYTVYSQGIVQPGWNEMLSVKSPCGPATMFVDPPSTDNREFIITNNGDNPVTIQSIEVKPQNFLVMDPQTQEQNFSIVIEHKSSLNTSILYQCKNQTILDGNIDGWTYVAVTIKTDGGDFSFNHLKVCTMENRKGADYSTYIVLLIAIIMVATQTKQKVTILGEQAQHADEIQPIHALFFVVFASISLMIIYFFSQYVQDILTAIFFLYALISCAFIFGQWTESFVENRNFWTQEHDIDFLVK